MEKLYTVSKNKTLTELGKKKNKTGVVPVKAKDIGRESCFPLEHPHRTNPVDILILDFKPPTL